MNEAEYRNNSIFLADINQENVSTTSGSRLPEFTSGIYVSGFTCTATRFEELPR